jgi:hypothetical protein
VFSLKCYQPTILKASFYIQCKGEHSGKPLKKPIPNCFACYSENENLFSLVYALYVGGYFKIYLKGSVIPFITIDETKKLINQYLHASNNKELKAIEQIDNHKALLINQLKTISELQKAVCFKALQGK